MLEKKKLDYSLGGRADGSTSSPTNNASSTANCDSFFFQNLDFRSLVLLSQPNTAHPDHLSMEPMRESFYELKR
jgi:hypothetical protein